MKQVKEENKILIMLALFSISIGLWGNFRQLWLQDNGLVATQISSIISIGTFISVIGIALIGKFVTLHKLKKTLVIVMFIKFINLLALYYLNGSNQMNWIHVCVVIDIVMEYIIVTSIYPLITIIVKNNTIYSKRKLTEYLFKDIGIFFGGVFIGKTIAGILVNYNMCLMISNLFLMVSLITLIKITINPTNQEEKKKPIVKYLLKDKIICLYLIDVFIRSLAMSTALGLKMLTLTNYFSFSDNTATNYLLIVGLLADGIGMIALKYLTPKNDYITTIIKFGIRWIGYVLAFITNSMLISLIAITWGILISTAYENICDGIYINRVENEQQLSFANVRYIIKFIGDAIGVFFCGMMYELGVRYMLGLSALIMVFHMSLGFYLIYLRNKENGENIA